jgi:haloacetate dehalogenase
VSIDREDLKANPQRVTPPVHVLWGAKGTVGKTFDVLALWRNEAQNVSGYALPCGHLIPEEVPGHLLNALNGYLKA